jgi:oligopeptide/dipeptide ABC transporter ATP-binding protein
MTLLAKDTIGVPPDDILTVKNVAVSLTKGGRTMVSGVSFGVRRGELFGIVGESGSGKTLLTLSLFGLHGETEISAGEITFDGKTLFEDGKRRRSGRILGCRIGFIPQDPYSSLNPSMRVGRQITEAIYLARGTPPNSRQCRDEAVALLAEVGIPEPETAFRQYPDQFSGGMRQRIVIAIALSQDPALLIADEPTTALDAFTQRRIIDLIVERSRSRNLSVILISHNLELLRQSVDHIAVLYSGQLMNIFETADLGRNPLHPYTEALFECILSVDKTLADIRSILGEPAGAGFGLTGCAFADRCAYVQDICRTARLPENTGRADSFSACFLGKGVRT